MTITPNPPYNTGDLLVALCVWREARGCSFDAKRGVVWVLLNRRRMAPAQGFQSTMDGNVLKPWAFSSFAENDPNSTKYPAVESDPSWDECVRAVAEPGEDPTNGACFYYSQPITTPPRAWGNVIITEKIDELTFCAFSEVVT